MHPRAVALALLLVAAFVPAAAVPGYAQQAARRTPDIHYVPTPDAAVDAMLTMADVGAADVVYDLGSGDGRIVITAAARHGARGVGIEIDGDLVRRAEAGAREAGVADRVRFSQADLFQTDLSEATVITLYLSPSVNLRLRSKLQGLRPGTRIVAYRFAVPDWPPDRQIEVDGTPIYSWVIPPR
ncbi:MAG: methyltransferase domain-containing protein [Acidobacteria bacterium]|nr:methyltransferase domain-containing protein [Acidobacteriota bacterium]